MVMDLVADFDIQQFTFFPCSLFDSAFLECCQEGMGLINERNVPVTDEMFFVIVSQTCDISNSNDPYVEGFIFEKVKPRQAKKGNAIKYTRNYQKILVNEIVNESDDWFLIKKAKRVFLHKDLLIDNLQKIDIRQKHVFSKDNCSMLLDWLTKSYTRVALPDGFNQAFFTNCKNEEHPIHTFLIRNKDYILDIFVFCSPLDDENAQKYDVTFTALVSSMCEPDKKESLENEFRELLKTLSQDGGCLNLLQISDEQIDDDIHERALMDLVMSPNEFTKQDEFFTHRLNLDFICFMSAESE